MKSSELIALVFRQKSGCAQYPFASIAELREWCARKPYSREQLKATLIHDGRPILDSAWMPADQLPDWVESGVT